MPETQSMLKVVSEMAFIRKEASEDGKSMLFYFVTEEYLPQYEIKMKPKQLIENFTETRYKDFNGNLKFKLKAEEIPTLKNVRNLIAIKPFYEVKKTYVVEYGLTHKHWGNNHYLSTQFIDLFEDWDEYSNSKGINNTSNCVVSSSN